MKNEITSRQRIIRKMPVDIDYRPVIFWGINAEVEPDGISIQLDAFKRSGYGGVMILPWGGMPYGFMSEKWLDAVEWIIEGARERGMEVWIWDDWLFPSGFAGGVLGREVEHRSRRLKIMLDVVLEDGESFEMPVPPRAISAGVFPIDKFNKLSDPYEHLSTEGKIAAHASEGRRRLVCVGWEFVADFRYTVESHSRFLREGPKQHISKCEDETAWSVDMLNRATTRRFLDLIHEKYYARLAPHFGKTFKGFFFDEPDIPSFYPWTIGFDQEFAAKKGYDIRDWLVRMLATYPLHDKPTLFSDEEVQKARADYNDVWTSMLADNFYGVIQEWCQTHGVISTGHEGWDESVGTILSRAGVFFKNMAHNDIPGIDVVFDHVDVGKFVDYPRFAGSSRNLGGKRFALTETFGAMGHGMHIDLMRFVIEYQLIRGINKFMYKVANYNVEKSFYFHPPELSPLKNEFIRDFGRTLNERTEKLCALMSSGEPVERICLFVPLDNYYRNDTTLTPVIDALARELTYRRCEYDYVRECDLDEMQVEDGKLISASGMVYTDIIVPKDSLITESLKSKLADLANQGARIVSPESECAGLISTANIPVQMSETEVPVSSLTRKLGDERYATFFLNESNQDEQLDLACADGWALVEEELRDGDTYLLGQTAKLRFRSSESRLVFAVKNFDGVQPPPEMRNPITLNYWELETPFGKKLNLSGALPSWSRIGCGDYSGYMTYRTRLDWQSDSPYAVLDLGRVCYAARVSIDGREAADLPFTPYRAKLELSKGEHTLEISVLNTFANQVFGTEDRYRELKESGVLDGTYEPVYEKVDRKRLTSGLLGPVVIYQI